MRIKGVPTETASPKVERVYSKCEERLGRVPTPYTAFGHCPEALEAMFALSDVLTNSEVIDPSLKTLACIRAAQIAGCPF